MTVAIKAKPRAGWLAVPRRPEANDAVACVELVGCINEKESPFLLVLFLGVEGLCRVHRALYPGFGAGAQLYIPARVLGLGAGYF